MLMLMLHAAEVMVATGIAIMLLVLHNAPRGGTKQLAEPYAAMFSDPENIPKIFGAFGGVNEFDLNLNPENNPDTKGGSEESTGAEKTTGQTLSPVTASPAPQTGTLYKTSGNMIKAFTSKYVA
jgi:hypothetical protein